jgi:hypothetical protein
MLLSCIHTTMSIVLLQHQIFFFEHTVQLLNLAADDGEVTPQLPGYKG